MHTSINLTDDIYSCDMYVCLQIKKREGRDVLVTYFILDNLGGYQKEKKSFYIDRLEIMNKISRPVIKRIGRRRSTFLFPDLKNFK